MTLFNKLWGKENYLPQYNRRGNFNTNAESYYKYLERVNEILKIMAKMLDEQDEKLDDGLQEIRDTLQDYINQLEIILAGVDDYVVDKMVEWLNDGTLEHIINHEIFQDKLDTAIFEQFELSVNQQLAQIERKIIRVFSTGLDDTGLIQSSISELEDGGRIEFYGDFLCDHVQFEHKNNIEIIVNGSFKRNDNTPFPYSLFFISNCDGVSIPNILKTDGNAFSYSESELNNEIFQRHSIDIRHSKNINIGMIVDKNTPGDTIAINNVDYLTIGSIKTINDRLAGRNVVSLIKGNNIHINSVYGRNVGIVGQPGGVDLEPNFITDEIHNVSVTNIDVTTAGTIGIAVQNIVKAPITNIRLEGKVEKLPGTEMNVLDYSCLVSNCTDVKLDILAIQRDTKERLCRGVTLKGVNRVDANFRLINSASGVAVENSSDFNVQASMDNINTAALLLANNTNGVFEMQRLSGFGYGLDGIKPVILLSGDFVKDVTIRGDFAKRLQTDSQVRVLFIPVATQKTNVRIDSANFTGYTGMNDAYFSPANTPETTNGLIVTNTIGLPELVSE